LSGGELFQQSDQLLALLSAQPCRDAALVHLAVAPQWDCLRADDRLGERLQAMGLADAAERAQRFLRLR